MSCPPLRRTIDPCAPASVNQHTIDRPCQRACRPIPFPDYLQTQNRTHPAPRQGDLYATLNRKPTDAPSPPTRHARNRPDAPRIGDLPPAEAKRIQRTLEITYHLTRPLSRGLRIDQII